MSKKTDAKKTAAAKAVAKKTASACGAPSKQGPRMRAAPAPRVSRTTLLVVAEGTRLAAAIARSIDHERAGASDDESMRWISAIALLHLLDDEATWDRIVAQSAVDVAFEKLGSQAKAILLRAWALG